MAKRKTNFDLDQSPWREHRGLTFVYGHELAKRPSRRDPHDYSRLAVAIRRAFPTSHPEQRALMFRRWKELYDLPLEDALTAVRAGFSSPSAAMRSGNIKLRNYRGFSGDR